MSLDNSLASGSVLLEGACGRHVATAALDVFWESMASSHNGQEAQMLQCLQADGSSGARYYMMQQDAAKLAMCGS